jgi:hypothetical protein
MKNIAFVKTYTLYNYFLASPFTLHLKDDLSNFRWRSYNILNHSKLIKNVEVMMFESRRDQNEQK